MFSYEHFYFLKNFFSEYFDSSSLFFYLFYFVFLSCSKEKYNLEVPPTRPIALRLAQNLFKPRKRPLTSDLLSPKLTGRIAWITLPLPTSVISLSATVVSPCRSTDMASAYSFSQSLLSNCKRSDGVKIKSSLNPNQSRSTTSQQAKKRCLRCNTLYSDKDNSPTACSFHGHTTGM